MRVALRGGGGEYAPATMATSSGVVDRQEAERTGKDRPGGFRAATDMVSTHHSPPQEGDLPSSLQATHTNVEDAESKGARVTLVNLVYHEEKE